MKKLTLLVVLVAALTAQAARAEPDHYADPENVAEVAAVHAAAMAFGCTSFAAISLSVHGVKGGNRYKGMCAEGAAMGAAVSAAAFAGVNAAMDQYAIPAETLNAPSTEEIE